MSIQVFSRLLVVYAMLVPSAANAQFIAFNDHAPGAGTSSNATTWNVMGDSPGSTGPLKDIKTGANLPVILTITRSQTGVSGASSQGTPALDTPLYRAFNSFVDFQGTPNPSLELSGSGLITYTFTGLNPNKRYSFKGSAVRGNETYTDRWTLFEIVGVNSFTSAHTPNALTTAKVTSISTRQVAINTGGNSTPDTGDMADWENIDPGADGAFAVTCGQYTGVAPGGSAAGSKGYGMTGIRLEEFNVTQMPATITTQPQSQLVNELQPVTFTVAANGNPPPSIQWYKNGSPISGATNASYSIAMVRASDDGALFKALAANTVGNINYIQYSSNAVLHVLFDTTPPVLLDVKTLGLSQIRLTFSKPITPGTATNTANYLITSGTSTATVLKAVFDETQQNVLLHVDMLTENLTYILSVNGIKDLSAAGNLIAANSQKTFAAVTYAPLDIGNPPIPGGIVAVSGGYDLSGGGADIGGTKDQFQFAYQTQTGNFDFQVRLADLNVTDPYVKAGLMVRENLQDTNRFAGIFASSVQLGCFFESRSSAATVAVMAGPAIKFPANYPWAWLRLRRNGNDFTGYGSFDGKAWQQLGAANMSLPSQVFFGMAVTSSTTNSATIARFRDLGPVVNPVSFTYRPNREALGPSNRRTGLIFSEIMYHPRQRTDGKNLEYVEIYNGEAIFVNLTGWRISGGIDFAFPDGFCLQAGQFAVIAADPQAVQSLYGINGVLGPYQRSLSNSKDSLILLNQARAVRAELTYSSKPPWPTEADGPGHSLVCLKPSYGENDSRAWGASQLIGGSPGYDDPTVPHLWGGVVISEFLAIPQGEDTAFIELYNAGNAAVDLSGCFLTDSAKTNKFRIPERTVLEAKAWISFAPEQFGFEMSASEGVISLVSADQTRVLDSTYYGAQEQGISVGRFPDGGPLARRLSLSTPGQANATWKPEDVVFNELMYKPISGDPDDQYIEIFNRSKNAVDLSGWRLMDGISYSFPSGTLIPAGGYLVVARNVQRMLMNYPQLNLNNTLGNFAGKLNGGGDRVVLAKPVIQGSDMIHVTVSEVSYMTGGRWPELANGGGSSLELKDSHSDLLMAANWAASDETRKANWGQYEFTGTLGASPLANQSYAANKLFIISHAETECLIDEVEVFKAGSTNILNNPGFENGQTGWNFYGTHLSSSIESGGAFSGNNCLHLRSVESGDEGPNSIRGTLTATITANSTVTIRARARWLSGWPEILLRVRGNGVELPVMLQLPVNLGTPGLPNSRNIDNAGPAICETTHYPPVPAAGQPVSVTARIADPDGVFAPQVIYRVDPSATTKTVMMRDDGTGGDLLAGDGIYTAAIPGQASGLIAYRIQAQDGAAIPASSLFPIDAPKHECLIRWADPTPFGSFPHYHLWSTAANATDITSKPGLDRRYRDCTIVYNTRTMYNAGWRNKGSPFHGGTASYSARFADDDLFLGSGRHVFRSTGNGATESTQMADDVTYWIGGQMGLPYCHSHYIRLYRNGTLHYPLDYDIEVPDRSMAKDWFGGGGVEDTLFKISGWFEYDDSNNNGTSSLVWASFQKKPASGPPFKAGAYRFNWLPHPGGNTANNYSSIFNLIAAANATDKITQLMNLADVEQWMRTFAFRRVVGDWDSWSYNTGQNMYMYAPLGQRATLMSWDMDFVIGLGDSASANQLFSAGQDGVIGALFNVPAYRRMLWRAYQDAVNGPLQKAASDAQFDSRRAIILKNNVTGTSTPTSLKNYVSSRRSFLQTQIKNADAAAFAVTTRDFSTSAPIATITGVAPFGVASIEINGIPYPITWTSYTAWSIKAPLYAVTNILQISGKDLRGGFYPGATGQVTVTCVGPVPQPQDWVVINEIMYHAPAKDAEFIELFNQHPTYAFDLSGVKIKGADFSFVNGVFIQPNSYLVVVKDSAAFAQAYGATISVAGEYSGTLQHDGEIIRIVKPGLNGDQDLVIDEIRYENVSPWPAEADGLGPSLQLIDAAQDNRRAANWAVMVTNDVNRATPGRANANRMLLDPFPTLWINEVLSSNKTGQTDKQGERDPWIELYNAGSTIVDLGSYYLSNDRSNLTRWQFPSGTTLGPGAFLVVWADGPPDQSLPIELHTNFRLDGVYGFVALSRIQSGFPAVLDYVNYPVALPDQSFGAAPDGDPWNRQPLFIPTPNSANIAADRSMPNFSKISLSGGKLTLDWTTSPGSNYRIEFKDELGQQEWIPLTADLIAIGDHLSTAVSFTEVPHRYFRVVQVK